MSCGGNCDCGKSKNRDADAAFDLLNRLKSDTGSAAVPAVSWWLKNFRITRVRVIAQFFFFAL
ncbi:MAG: hypothetical protein WCS70_16520, partial [Verrucomicrobiota bacterium]